VLSVQAAYATGFWAVRALALAISHYQVKHRQIGKVRLVSPRAKHAIGLVFLLIGGLIFAGQFFTHRPFPWRQTERQLQVVEEAGQLQSPGLQIQHESRGSVLMNLSTKLAI
jgi:hypothetical protein